MSGQDSIMGPIGSALEVIKDTLSVSVFDLSQIASGLVPVESGFEMVPKVQVLHPVWLFLYLFALIGFFALIRLYYGNILIQTVQASTNFQVASRMFQDNSQLQKQLDTALYALYFLSIALLLYIVEKGSGLIPYEFEGIVLFLFNLAILVSIFFGRVVLVNLTGLLFNNLKFFREYLYNIFIFNKLIGMTVVPFLLFIVYTNGLLQELIFGLTLTTVAIVVTMRLIRGFVFSFKKDISFFYMFLYLCALEIVPLALMYRWLEGIL